uniref:Uncharacterized protein n=1 Tax=Setaria italica TaxID=4555 RepID=K4ANR6_SETIT
MNLQCGILNIGVTVYMIKTYGYPEQSYSKLFNLPLTDNVVD